MKIYIPADLECSRHVGIKDVTNAKLVGMIKSLHNGDFLKVSKVNIGNWHGNYPLLLDVFGCAMQWANVPDNIFVLIKHSPHLRKTICDATVAVAFAKYDDAYQVFQKSDIKEITPALVSYYLHLASYLNNEPIKAVILDDKIVCALWFLETKERKEWRDCLTKEGIVSDAKSFKAEWNVSSYLKHLKRVNYWATQLGCKPFEIEIFLLQKGTNCKLIDEAGGVQDKNVSDAADMLSI